MKIKAIIHTAEEGGYWAEVPIFNGCYTQRMFEKGRLEAKMLLRGMILNPKTFIIS